MWYYTFYLSITAVLGALLFQAVRLAVPAVGRRALAATSAGTITLTAPAADPPWAAQAATLLTRTAAASLTLTLVLRTVDTGRPPYSDMWEYMVAVGWGTSVLWALFERRYRHPAIGSIALGLVATLLIVPELLFSSQITALVPALRNNRLLSIHVASMLLSYSALTLAFAAAVLYLIQGKENRYAWLPKAQLLETFSYRAVLVGFPLLALGIALGAYWGNIAWGRYWGWDPKETTALVTWLIFAGYMHARSLGGWRGRRAAWIIVAGFVMIVFNIFVVNFWIAGLHSYAGPR